MCLPLLFIYISSEASWNVLYSMLFAELLTNLHSFIIIVTLSFSLSLPLSLCMCIRLLRLLRLSGLSGLICIYISSIGLLELLGLFLIYDSKLLIVESQKIEPRALVR